MVNPRKKPSFERPGSKMYKRVKEGWRRPRGLQNKVRRKKKGRPKMPTIGWSAPKKLRGKHPSGLEEILVRNIEDLEKIDPNKQAARIASTVGKKKRIEIMKKAKELNIRVLNPIEIPEEK